jgi:hypothetical protein
MADLRLTRRAALGILAAPALAIAQHSLGGALTAFEHLRLMR